MNRMLAAAAVPVALLTITATPQPSLAVTSTVFRAHFSVTSGGYNFASDVDIRCYSNDGRSFTRYPLAVRTKTSPSFHAHRVDWSLMFSDRDIRPILVTGGDKTTKYDVAPSDYLTWGGLPVSGADWWMDAWTSTTLPCSKFPKLINRHWWANGYHPQESTAESWTVL